jgi:integrase
LSKNGDLKTFRGKRVYKELSGYRNISRLYFWNEEKKIYEPPIRGCSYQAYRYEIANSKRKRISKFFQTLEEARQWQASQQVAQTNNEPMKEVGPTFIEVVEFWRRSEEKLMTGTKIYYDKLIGMYDYIHNKVIHSICATDVDQMLEQWHNGYISANRLSFDRELETLNFFVRWYINNYDDAKAISPVKDRHWKRSQLNRNKAFKRTYMFQEELDQFLLAVKEISGDMWLAFATVQVKQFMRVSETAGMKWSNLFPRKKEYFLCEHVTWPRVDGAPARIESGTKNRDARESFMLPLFQDSLDALTSQKRHPGCDLIFHDNGEILTYRQIQYVYELAFKRARLPFRGTHVLRHTGATLFQSLSEGDRLALQFLGGWKTSRQPEHYAKIISSVGRKAIDKIEQKGKLVLLKTE